MSTSRAVAQRRIKSDDHSNHNLPIGAWVTPYSTRDGVDFYTMGIVGDEVAIDPRDLEEQV